MTERRSGLRPQNETPEDIVRILRAQMELRANEIAELRGAIAAQNNLASRSQVKASKVKRVTFLGAFALASGVLQAPVQSIYGLFIKILEWQKHAYDTIRFWSAEDVRWPITQGVIGLFAAAYMATEYPKQATEILIMAIAALLLFAVLFNWPTVKEWF